MQDGMAKRGRPKIHSFDAGCKYADEFLGYKSFCLECPFKECILDESEGTKIRIVKTRRDQEILNLINQGVKPKEVAGRFGIHVRTVERVITRSNKGEQLSSPTALE